MTQKFLLALSLLIIVLCFSQCKSNQYNFQKKTPFKITEATYQNWVGGKPGSNGVTISFTTENLYVNLDSVYFRGKAANLVYEKHNKKMQYVGKITTSSQGDLVLHKDEKMEFGNKPPKQQNKIPFDLKDNEAVVSYTVNGKVLYYKIEDVKELQTLFHQ